MADSIYEHRNYKQALKSRLKIMKRRRPSLSLRKLADAIDIQYTYLSKVLNDDVAQLSEDHLFGLAKELECNSDESEFLFLLRSYQATSDDTRREHLHTRIEETAQKKILGAEYASSVEFESEVRYLFEPLAGVINMSLLIPKYQRNPRVLCAELGISQKKLKEVLITIEDIGLIEFNRKDWTIKRLQRKRRHFSREHPLTRSHQSVMKTALQARLNESSEEDKENFMVTFTMDRDGFGRVQKAFKEFIKVVEQESKKGNPESVCQLNFEFLRWM